MAVFVHTCDISNSSLPFYHFKRWGIRIIQELDDLYHAEGALLDADKSPPLPFLRYVSEKSFMNSQIMFTNSFCLPLQQALLVEWPELKFFEEKTLGNIAQYETLKADL
jgi:hypothetical protein